MALTKNDVLAAALVILDEYGLPDLTMRRLGDALDVRAGALYHHVPNKQTLLACIADLIVAEAPEPLGRWRPALAGWANGLREALLSHRDSAELVASARAMGLAERDASSHPTALLVSGGLGRLDAAGAATTLLHFILGHVAEEQARQDWERFGRPDPDRTPTTTAASFELGVGLLLDGIASRMNV